MYPGNGRHCDRSRRALFDLDLSSRYSVPSLVISNCCPQSSLNPVAGRVARALARAWLVPGSAKSRHRGLDQVAASCVSGIRSSPVQFTINRRDAYQTRRGIGELRRAKSVMSQMLAPQLRSSDPETRQRFVQTRIAGGSVDRILSGLRSEIWK